MKIGCVICAGTVQKDAFAAAPCGHAFHLTCLNEWLKHQKTCPQCRESCTPRRTLRLYLEDANTTINMSSQLDQLSAQDLKEKLQEMESLSKEKDEALKKAKKELEEIRQEVTAWQAQCDGAQFKIEKEKAISESLKHKLKLVQSEQEILKEKAKEATELKEKVHTLERIELLLSGTRDEAHEVIFNSSSTSLSNYVIALKSEYDTLNERKVVLQREKDKYLREVTNLKHKVRSLNMDLQSANSDVLTLRADLQSAEVEKDNLRKKVHLLEKALESPNSRTTLQRILESPMPEALAKRQKLMANDCSPQLSTGKDENAEPAASKPISLTEALVPVRKLNNGATSTISSGFNGFGGQSMFIKPKAKAQAKKPFKFAPRAITNDNSKQTKLLAMKLKF
ncbi:PREDICTED: E3 ubiquitin-protein ligase TRAIP-like [Amphimedon queenslandica]|uniref:RING-type domain-containing protein n=1 Tax=Amphimedon queenslandica TaxID=400682 RepID=A0A1X7VU58_AMPQE|nr:PREDICTED: E3 ubiquitin-protein ligase TRAIP-like [Amphimedon queenslandica]|eukprot:XP_019850583.1 PREDICTED: E3 ubiquitin-protein ligase TRAIP-like [Amphimedon queenslandica]